MKEAGIQFLIYKPQSLYNPPRPPLPETQRGVVINPRHKERFRQFIPVGVFKDENNKLKYYFFDQCDLPDTQLTVYDSLEELKQALPEAQKDIFEKKPKFYVMGHANGAAYGMGNCNDESEQLYDDHFNALINDIKSICPQDKRKMFVTLEGCNTDNQHDAEQNEQTQTFLERLSSQHPEITFGGSGPWNLQDEQTGYRSLSPASPVTSMVGNVWKAGNSVIFHHEGLQIAVRKSLFASTETAQALKMNTLDYARALLGPGVRTELISEIALRRDILTIHDLDKVDGFPKLEFKDATIANFVEQEKHIIGKEHEHYLGHVRDILKRAEQGDKLTDRDYIELLLGIKDQSVFQGHEHLLEAALANQTILQQMMVSCGKVLVGGPSNDSIIDFLIKNGANINSTDEKGMTALHYATQVFDNYREEPLSLIKKLLDSGASLEAINNKGQTPIQTAEEYSKDERVTATDKLLASLTKRNSSLTAADIEQSVRKTFQMSQHVADQKISFGEYSTCSQGTLYIPPDVLKELQKILQSAKSIELLSAFQVALENVISALETGEHTGAVNGQPKCFSDVKTSLQPILQSLTYAMEAERDRHAEYKKTFKEVRETSQHKDEEVSPQACRKP